MNIKPETVRRFQKVQHLLVSEKIDGDPITLKEACRRAGLSPLWFRKLRRAVDLGFKIEVETNAAYSAKENGGVNMFARQ